MIKVTIGTNTDRTEKIVNENKILSEFLTENRIGTNTQIFLDGNPISREMYSKTLTEVGINDGAFLIAVVKQDCAK